MCLDLKVSAKPKDIFGDKDEKVFYKVVSAYYPTILVSVYWGVEYKVGENKSNRWDKKLDEGEKEWQEVSKGIHVYTDKDRAIIMVTGQVEKILPVICRKEDLVAIGYRDEAVFMKVTVRQEDYDKAMQS